jgi:hypothetical protein
MKHIRRHVECRIDTSLHQNESVHEKFRAEECCETRPLFSQAEWTLSSSLRRPIQPCARVLSVLFFKPDQCMKDCTMSNGFSLSGVSRNTFSSRSTALDCTDSTAADAAAFEIMQTAKLPGDYAPTHQRKLPRTIRQGIPTSRSPPHPQPLNVS